MAAAALPSCSLVCSRTPKRSLVKLIGTPSALRGKADQLRSFHCHSLNREASSIATAPRVSPTAIHAASVLAPEKEASTEIIDEVDDELYTVTYDAVVIGSGMGGLATAARLTEASAKVVVLEKYLIPGGSAGAYERDGFKFDVGSSMMFGLGDKGETNLLTRCLASVGKTIESVPDPTQIHYHLPASNAHPTGLEPKVWRDYDEFISELVQWFPHEEKGIRAFYGDCWKVFNALNSLELKSLEEPRYLLGQFAKHPGACLTLAAMATSNSGDVARKYIKDEELLAFIDMECFCWSTVKAQLTPMINAGMVFCDRHYGGVNYPKGGVGRLAELLAEGVEDLGGRVVYRANVKEIVTEEEGGEQRAVGVRLANGKIIRGRTIISNATRWDTFEKLLRPEEIPQQEKVFLQNFKKSPSFFTMHLGVKADVLPADCQCHHIVLEDWKKLEDPHGTLFVSIPTVLDPDLSPDGTHIIHAFTPDFIDNWKFDSPAEYDAKKEEMAGRFIERLEALWPGLSACIVVKEIATPRTQRRFLNRSDGTYGPIPKRAPLGMLSMPLNTTEVDGLYCTGDSTFPGQGVNAVVFSGFGCAHRVLCDLDMEAKWPLLDKGLNSLLTSLRAVGTSTK
mmetsp:Transcript_7876/g.22496  ORF Transcript_7876/g.22496 Transcript_7876/m.22496 type:complete len:623 (+) Transcript_7876:195-2063(+)|eukprot:CAMPEP_0117663440 /NCGR_PEP_ID=MMETSP0804-20121206/8607_1 /TAXON_ID=1074897 /ORGANISM="Tetraselmis astigmatica, Strain CCMP880" /LENGTH=622 /DNA_ID=CAMNT_0005470445 /DNA_START=877 /DNA_END=2745 /DNA_ORIENTATION=-